MRIFFSFLLIISGNAYAEESNSVSVDTTGYETWAVAGVGFRSEVSNNQRSIGAKSGPQIRVGHRRGAWALELEAQRFATGDEGTDSIRVNSSELNFVVLASYSFRPTSSTWDPYVGLGLGTSQVRVETTLFGVSESSTGDWVSFARMAAGSWIRLTSHIRLGAELRANSSPQFNPRWNFGGAIHVGWTF